MDFATIRNAVSNIAKGANVVLSWHRDCKTRKGSPNVSKTVHMVGRLGIKYDNLGAVQEKRENGELPTENQGLPSWSEWLEFPYFIRHKDKGTVYLRMYKGSDLRAHPTAEFFIDGTPASKEQAQEFLLASELKGHGDSDCFNVNIDDLVSVGTV